MESQWFEMRAVKVETSAPIGEQKDKGKSVEGCRAMQVQTRRQLVRTYYRPPGESRQLQPSSRAHTQW